ncbi:hypothetical protein WHT83_14820 [Aminobacter sp. P9b]|uniref:hypothetical protein n=1 Tax=Aminobacter sp. P9b TaxID=3133697 RepID=UPI0032462D86
MAKLTRDQARKAWADACLGYSDLTDDRLRGLRALIDQEVKASGLIKGTFRATRAPRIVRNERWMQVEIFCRAFYFDKREAVTFNSDGFIGFAGWADEVNVQPILRAFIAWVAALAAPSAGAQGGEHHG